MKPENAHSLLFVTKIIGDRNSLDDCNDYIKEHKAKLLASRLRIEETWQHKLEPRRKHLAPDGGEIIATEKELLYIDHNGAIIGSSVAR